MEDPKTQVAARIKEANNILVTVSANPSVDQLAACIGVTLALNKMGKHATAVFSGVVPSTLAFLQPEKTLEKNTDSLRDFIIALDKSKADKLRYKVEDKVVKIFITPYKTSITDKDLEFSQGDFNVDVVLAIGVHSQAELDQAITSHGRILHDATVVTINSQPGGELGSINWLDATTSSLSELGVQLVDQLDKNLLDSQIATALLTGIVAETERFSNNKTSPRTMTLSAELMTAGANQQLVATKLEAPVPPTPTETTTAVSTTEQAKSTEDAPVKKADDGTLEIEHNQKAEAAAKPLDNIVSDADSSTDDTASNSPITVAPPAPAVPEAVPAAPAFLPEPELPKPKAPQIHIDEHGSLSPLGLSPDDGLPAISHHDQALKMVPPLPSMGSPLAATMADDMAPAIDPLAAAMPGDSDLSPSPDTAQSLDAPKSTDEGFSMPYEALESEPLPTPRPDETLREIEESVHSNHVADGQPANDAPLAPSGDLGPARDAVNDAINASSAPAENQPLTDAAAMSAAPTMPTSDYGMAPTTTIQPTVFAQPEPQPAANPAYNPAAAIPEPTFPAPVPAPDPSVQNSIPPVPTTLPNPDPAAATDPNTPPPVPPPFVPAPPTSPYTQPY
jgi:hypothetical protein